MKKELEFFDVSALPWEPVPGFTGLEQKILAGDKTSADVSRLARMAAEADFDEPLVHDFWEEIWILEGSVHDKRTGLTYTAGMYVIVKNILYFPPLFLFSFLYLFPPPS